MRAQPPTRRTRKTLSSHTVTSTDELQRSEELRGSSKLAPTTGRRGKEPKQSVLQPNRRKERLRWLPLWRTAEAGERAAAEAVQREAAEKAIAEEAARGEDDSEFRVYIDGNNQTHCNRATLETTKRQEWLVPVVLAQRCVSQPNGWATRRHLNETSASCAMGTRGDSSTGVA